MRGPVLRLAPALALAALFVTLLLAQSERGHKARSFVRRWQGGGPAFKELATLPPLADEPHAERTARAEERVVCWGRVVDSRDYGIAGARIYALPSGRYDVAAAGIEEFCSPVTSGARGRFGLPYARRPQLLLHVVAAGYVPFVGPLAADPGSAEVRVPLERGVAVGGRVVDLADGPLAGVTIELRGPQTWPGPAVAGRFHGRAALLRGSAASGPDGSFAVPGWPRGAALHLDVDTPGYVLAPAVRNLRADGVPLTLRLAALRGAVVRVCDAQRNVTEAVRYDLEAHPRAWRLPAGWRRRKAARAAPAATSQMLAVAEHADGAPQEPLLAHVRLFRGAQTVRRTVELRSCAMANWDEPQLVLVPPVPYGRVELQGTKHGGRHALAVASRNGGAPVVVRLAPQEQGVFAAAVPAGTYDLVRLHGGVCGEPFVVKPDEVTVVRRTVPPPDVWHIDPRYADGTVARGVSLEIRRVGAPRVLFRRLGEAGCRRGPEEIPLAGFADECEVVVTRFGFAAAVARVRPRAGVTYAPVLEAEVFK